MPSIASHFVIASLVSKQLEIKSNNFFIGNILPDIIDKENSHRKIKGQYYLIPDITGFLQNNNYEETILLGCLCHLLLDKYFLEEYVPNNIEKYDKINIFTKDKIYTDYTTMNPLLLKEFNLNLDYLNKLLKSINSKYILNKEKYLKNVESINSLDTINKLIYINFETYIKFLKQVSEKITKELIEIKNSKRLKREKEY